MAVSYKPGKYPSKLDWSLPGHVLGLYIQYTNVHGSCYATVIDQWQKRSWVKGYQRRMAKGALIKGAKQK